MSAEIILSDVSVEVNDETQTIIGNTVSVKDGLGEATVTNATNGGTNVVVVSQDVTNRVSSIKFNMPSTVESLNRARGFKTNLATNVVRVTGLAPDGTRYGRTMRFATMTNDPENGISADGVIECEFMGASLISS